MSSVGSGSECVMRVYVVLEMSNVLNSIDEKTIYTVSCRMCSQ